MRTGGLRDSSGQSCSEWKGKLLGEVIDSPHDSQGTAFLHAQQSVLQNDEARAADELAGDCEPSTRVKVQGVCNKADVESAYGVVNINLGSMELTNFEKHFGNSLWAERLRLFILQLTECL